MKKLSLLFLAVLILASVLFSLSKKPQDPSIIEVENFVVSKIKSCQGQNTDCLRKAAAAFINKYETKDVLGVFTKYEQEADFFSLCHTTLHFYGREIYKKTKSSSEGLNMCSSACFQGCLHGVLEGYLADKGISYDDDKAIRDEIIKICGERADYEKKELYNECLHGLGHALMFVTDGELPKALVLCDVLEDKERRDWCYSGAFMENSTSSTNKDHPSKYLKADDPMYPCNSLEDKYLDMCYTLQGLYFAKISGGDVRGVIELCSKVPKAYKPGCFRAIGQERVGNIQNMEEIRDGCYLISEKEFRTACIQGVVGALSTKYSGDSKLLLAFCSVLDTEDKGECYIHSKRYLSGWIAQKDELNQICLGISEEEFRNLCLEVN